jgi:hypothetical protein
MTKDFDKLVKIFLEKMTIQRKGLLPDEWKYYPNISEDDLKKGIYLDDWDLKDFQQFKKLLKIADRKKLYIFGQAYPYNTKARIESDYENTITSREKLNKKKEEEFEKDQNRLMSLYSRFGFVHTTNGYMYRPPNILKEEMTDAGVLGADGPYPTDDPRTPFVMGMYSRRGKVKTRKRRKGKKSR